MKARRKFVRAAVVRMIAKGQTPDRALAIARDAADRLAVRDEGFFDEEEPITEVIDAKLQFATAILKMRDQEDTHKNRMSVLTEFFK